MQREVFERIFSEPRRLGPHTLDSPVRYEVWRDFALTPHANVDLLLEPKESSSPEQVGKVLLEALVAAGQDLGAARLAIADAVVAVRVSFEHLVQLVLPFTDWLPLVDAAAALSEEQLEAHLGAALENATIDSGVRAASTLDVPARLQDVGRLRWFLLLVARIGRQDDDGELASEEPDARARAASASWLQNLFRGSVRSTTPPLSGVSVNRRAQTAIMRSRTTIKADAACRLFDVDGRAITWAVVDSGIEARHPAFRNRESQGGDHDAFERIDTVEEARWVNNTRVAATYNLVDAREALGVRGFDDFANFDVGDRIERARVIHDDSYSAPPDIHGTHVAGIIGADWANDSEPLLGICPRISFYDFRVLGVDGTGDEFSIITALNHIRRINEEAGRLVIAGVNLSFSLPHDVANYACGWTPVCQACEKLVESGVVVVVAAGNTGFRSGPGRRLADGTTYLPISITDPGNAQKVITVGSTDRAFPYRYGVSYFSARGPTADGRRKPDLLAPGERIIGPVGRDDRLAIDGTSQAAPHVSGVAALLLARHPELVGQPERVKEILCSSASDLGREHSFQGYGLVDALRALQSM